MGGHERLWVGGIVTVLPLSGVLVVHGSGLPLLVTYQGEKWCPTVVSCYRPLVSSHSVSQSPISQDTMLSVFVMSLCYTGSQLAQILRVRGRTCLSRMTEC